MSTFVDFSFVVSEPIFDHPILCMKVRNMPKDGYGMYIHSALNNKTRIGIYATTTQNAKHFFLSIVFPSFSKRPEVDVTRM